MAALDVQKCYDYRMLTRKTKSSLSSGISTSMSPELLRGRSRSPLSYCHCGTIRMPGGPNSLKNVQIVRSLTTDLHIYCKVHKKSRQKLRNQVNSLKMKLAMKEKDRRVANTEVQHVLLKQRSLIEELHREKSRLIKKLRVVESQRLTPEDETRLMELLDKKQQYQMDILNAEKGLRFIKGKLENAYRNQHSRQQANELKSLNRDLQYQEKWDFFEKNTCQALSVYRRIIRANNELGAEILRLLLFKVRFCEQYDCIKRLMAMGITEIVKTSYLHCVDSSDQRVYRSDYYINRRDIQINREKIYHHIMKLRKFVFTHEFVLQTSTHPNSIRCIISRDPIINPYAHHITDVNDRMNLCHAALRKFKILTKNKDISEMCRRYLKSEGKNLETFQEIYDRNNRNYELFCIVKGSFQRLFISKYLNGLKNTKKLEKRAILKNELEASAKICLSLERICDDDEYIIAKLKESIDRMLNKTGTYRFFEGGFLGVHRPLSNQNVVRYLSILRNRIGAILGLYNYRKNKSSITEQRRKGLRTNIEQVSVVSFSSPVLKTRNNEKKLLIATVSHSSDQSKTLGGKRKTLVEMQAEIDMLRKQQNFKRRHHVYQHREYRRY